jgi:hypothetical protein
VNKIAEMLRDPAFAASVSRFPTNFQASLRDIRNWLSKSWDAAGKRTSMGELVV